MAMALASIRVVNVLIDEKALELNAYEGMLIIEFFLYIYIYI